MFEPEESWEAEARCATAKDPETFFPLHKGGATDAKEVCFSCPVREECLDFAFRTNKVYGVWGGLAEEERRSLVRAGKRTAGTRPHRRWSPEDDAVLRQMHALGFTDNRMCTEMKRSPSVLIPARERLGLRPNPAKKGRPRNAVEDRGSMREVVV
jgi:WhiB family redox-sensing transcriptional regulator